MRPSFFLAWRLVYSPAPSFCLFCRSFIVPFHALLSWSNSHQWNPGTFTCLSGVRQCPGGLLVSKLAGYPRSLFQRLHLLGPSNCPSHEHIHFLLRVPGMQTHSHAVFAFWHSWPCYGACIHSERGKVCRERARMGCEKWDDGCGWVSGWRCGEMHG